MATTRARSRPIGVGKPRKAETNNRKQKAKLGQGGSRKKLERAPTDFVVEEGRADERSGVRIIISARSTRIVRGPSNASGRASPTGESTRLPAEPESTMVPSTSRNTRNLSGHSPHPPPVQLAPAIKLTQRCRTRSDSVSSLSTLTDIELPGSPLQHPTIISSHERKIATPHCSTAPSSELGPAGLPADDANLGPTPNGLDLAFDSTADLVSETAIYEAVVDLNYAITNFIFNVSEEISVASAKRRWKNYSPKHLQVQSETGHMKELEENLINSPQMDGRDLILEALLHDKICGILFKAFFEGEYCSGIDQKDQECLEKLLAEVHAKQPWRAFQRCRSIMVAAGLQVAREANVNSITDKVADSVKDIFITAYSHKSGHFRNKVVLPTLLDNRKPIEDIVQRALNLCVSTQRDIVSSQMKVTIAPRVPRTQEYVRFNSSLVDSAWGDMGSRDGHMVLGTHKFGLEGIDEYGQKKSFIHPEVITEPLLRFIGRLS